MITPEQKKLLTEMKNTPYGRALREYLNDKYNEIGDVLTIPNDSNIAAEALGRKFALKLLKDLFTIMEDKKLFDKQRNQYE